MFSYFTIISLRICRCCFHLFVNHLRLMLLFFIFYYRCVITVFKGTCLNITPVLNEDKECSHTCRRQQGLHILRVVNHKETHERTELHGEGVGVLFGPLQDEVKVCPVQFKLETTAEVDSETANACCLLGWLEKKTKHINKYIRDRWKTKELPDRKGWLV